VIAAQLGQIGIKVDLVPTDRAKLSTDATTGKWDGIISFQWGTISEPDPMLAWVFMREGNNALGNPEIKKLVVAGRQETDPVKRDKIYQDMYRVAHDQAPWLFVHAGDELWGKAKGNPWQPYHISGSKGYFWFFVPPPNP
jgi:ABC-type transport system substrate-binding protein